MPNLGESPHGEWLVVTRKKQNNKGGSNLREKNQGGIHKAVYDNSNMFPRMGKGKGGPGKQSAQMTPAHKVMNEQNSVGLKQSPYQGKK